MSNTGRISAKGGNTERRYTISKQKAATLNTSADMEDIIGPGAYNVPNLWKNVSNYKNFPSFSFYKSSSCDRFTLRASKLPGVGNYNPESNAIHAKLPKFALSKAQRFFRKTSLTSNAQFYNSTMPRKAKGGIICQSQRFTNARFQSPGPSKYSFSTTSFPKPSKKRTSFYRAVKKSIFSQGQKIPGPGEYVYNLDTLGKECAVSFSKSPRRMSSYNSNNFGQQSFRESKLVPVDKYTKSQNTKYSFPQSARFLKRKNSTSIISVCPARKDKEGDNK